MIYKNPSNIEAIIITKYPIVELYSDIVPNLPKVNINLWESRFQKSRKGMMDGFKEACHYPFMIDSFDQNNDERYKWKIKMLKDHHWFDEFYNKTALCGSAVDVLFEIVGVDKGYVGSNKPQLLELSNQQNLLDKEYGDKTTKEKIEFVRIIRTKGYKILNFLSKQSPIKNNSFRKIESQSFINGL